MRIRGDDGIEGGAFERGDVGAREHLVQTLLADPAHIVAGVRFAVIENAEIDAGLVQQGGEGLA